MKYRNAAHILPDELLQEIQKYTEGEAIYIPKKEEKQRWGAGSGARQYYEERNEKIQKAHKTGTSIEELSENYNLSVESIRRIVYKRREE